MLHLLIYFWQLQQHNARLYTFSLSIILFCVEVLIWQHNPTQTLSFMVHFRFNVLVFVSIFVLFVCFLNVIHVVFHYVQQQTRENLDSVKVIELYLQLRQNCPVACHIHIINQVHTRQLSRSGNFQHGSNQNVNVILLLKGRFHQWGIRVLWAGKSGYGRTLIQKVSVGV